MATSEADKVAYCGCMDQVSRRLRITRSLVARRVSTGDAAADSELGCLLLRKMLEQVAYSGLAASRDAYSSLRPDFQKEWSATRILERLEKVHPDFYPVPLVQERLGPTQVHFKLLADGYLTRDEFVFLYDKCSDAIHDWNPFRPGPRIVDLTRSIEEWAERIERLLSCHRVRLVRQSDVLIVQLAGPDGRAHVLTASPLEV